MTTHSARATEGAIDHQTSDPAVSHGVGGEGTPIVGILYVKVLKLASYKKGNPYVILNLTNDSVSPINKTTVYRGNADPEWNEEFTMYVQDHSSQWLDIWVQDAAKVDVHDLVGYMGFALSDQNPGETYTYISNLTNHVAPFEQNKHGATLMFELVYRYFATSTKFEDVCPLRKAPIGTPQGGGLLVVIIHQALHLKKKHHNNPYAALLFRGELRKTMCIKKTDYPQWEEEFIFVLEEPPMNEELCLEVISSPLKGLLHRKEESMGHANISVADVVSKKRINKTYNLENGSGSVHVQVQWRTSD